MNRKPHIVVVGSANIDMVTYTDAIPRPGETIFGEQFSLGYGGKGANQAVAARLCGADVSMVVVTGGSFRASHVRGAGHPIPRPARADRRRRRRAGSVGVPRSRG